MASETRENALAAPARPDPEALIRLRPASQAVGISEEELVRRIREHNVPVYQIVRAGESVPAVSLDDLRRLQGPSAERSRAPARPPRGADERLAEEQAAREVASRALEGALRDLSQRGRELAEAHAERARLADEITKKDAAQREQASARAALERRIAELEAAKAEESRSGESQRGRVAGLTADLERLTGELSGAAFELARERDQREQAVQWGQAQQARVEELVSELAPVRARVTELEGALATASEDLGAFERRAAQLAAEHEEQARERDELSALAEDLEARLAAQTVFLAETHERARPLEGELRQAADERDRLRERVAALEAGEADLSRARQRVTELEAELAARPAQLPEAVDVAALEAQLASERAERERLTSDKRHAARRIEAFEERVKLLEERSTRSGAAAEALTQEVAELKRELEAERAARRREVETERLRVADLAKKLDASRRIEASTQRYADKKEQELRRLEDSLRKPESA